MDKKITLEDGNIIKLNSDGRSVIIDKGYLQNGEPSKIITMFMGDDFGFEAFTFSDDKKDNVEFQVPVYDPLYKHLNFLLGENDSLIIDDDMTEQNNKKYMKVQKEDQNILIGFYNNLKEFSITNKFIITIINIMRDGRSKIDREGLDTKERLVRFFSNVEKDFLDKEKEVEER